MGTWQLWVAEDLAEGGCSRITGWYFSTRPFLLEKVYLDMGVKICFQGANREMLLGKCHLSWSILLSLQDRVLQAVSCAAFCLTANTGWDNFPLSRKPV